MYRSPYPDIEVPDLNLTEQVFRKAVKKPDTIAMADGLSGRTITYGSLLEQIRQTAAGFAARGIKKGDVVSLWSPNVPEWPIVFFGVIRLGAIVHTSNPVGTPEELAFQLKDANAKILVTIGALADKAKTAIAESGMTIELITLDETPGLTPSDAGPEARSDPRKRPHPSLVLPRRWGDGYDSEVVLVSRCGSST